MEEERKDIIEEETIQEKPHYVPRPMWQVWAARVALVVFIVGMILYYLNVFGGGQ